MRNIVFIAVSSFDSDASLLRNSSDAHEHAHSAHGPCEATISHDNDHHFLDGDTSQEPQTYTIMEDEEVGPPTERSPMLSKRKSTSFIRPLSMQRRFSSQRQLLYGTMGNHSKDCCLNDPAKIRQILLQNGHASPSLSARSPHLGNGHLHSHAHHEEDHEHDHNHDHGHGDIYHASRHNAHHSHQPSHKEEQHHSAHQIIGVAILEFGVVLHSFVVGMTLAVVERFPTLFVVITLHRKSLLPKY